MNDVLTFIYSGISYITQFIFNDMLIVNGVSVGWVMVVLIVFGILISNILNLPRSMGSFNKFRSNETVSTTYYDDMGYKHTYWHRYKQ